MRKFSKTAYVQEDKCRRAPCQENCPAGVYVPAYIGLIGKKDFINAYKTIRAGVPFPSVCGRICHHPCESACRRVGRDEALAIRALKRVPGDYLFAREGLPPVSAERANGIKIAVAGSGPAGLSAAFYLARKGYAVNVFEARSAAGGMMMFGIPGYRLPKDVLLEEIKVIEGCGVKIKTGVSIGKDITIEQLFNEGYQAVFLATGADRGDRLCIPGDDLDGVLTGIDFLCALNKGDAPDFHDKKVAVIGAGNVAADAARSAVRLGAVAVTVYYRRAEQDMPVTEEELLEMEHEGIKIRTMIAPVKITGKDGRVCGLELIKTRRGKLDAGGRYAPVIVEGSAFNEEADVVIGAIGYRPDAAEIDLRLATTGWGGIAVNRETMDTGLANVLAGGDCVTGASTVVEAVAEGKKAASIIDRMFDGDGCLTGAGETVLPADESFLPSAYGSRRAHERRAEKIDAFCETNLGYSLEAALSEAQRCLHCDLVCHTCEKVCPVLAITGKQTGVRAVACVQEEYCTGCGICEQRCPDQAIVLRERPEVRISDVKADRTLDEVIKVLCQKAHMQPGQIVCYCHRVKASEIAAAILSGARTPEDVARLTGARTGCGVLCANSTMRLLEAAGIELGKAPGYQWYGGVPTIWKLTEEVLAKYDKEFRLSHDLASMNKLFPDK